MILQIDQHLIEPHQARLGLAGRSVLKCREDLKLEAYLDGLFFGKWTIGYGHTRSAKKGMKITEAEAERLLSEDLSEFIRAYRRHVTVRLPQLSMDAIILFCYNIGYSAFASSTLLKRLNQGDFVGAEKEFHRWVYAQKKRLFGLGVRRGSESSLFIAGLAQVHLWPGTEVSV